MWDRKELKEKAKDFLRGNYGNALAVSVIIGLLNSYDKNPVVRNISETLFEFSASPILTFILLFILSLLFKTFVINPLLYGGQSFFLRSVSYGKSDISDIMNAFREENYANIVKTMFLQDIFITLWAIPALLPLLLLLIFSRVGGNDLNPGLIFLFGLFALALLMFKSYQYRFIPFILDDYPEMPPLEIIKRSKALTKGHKFGMFILDFSFTGWYILGILLLFIGVILVQPYHQSTIAFLYLELEELEAW